MLEVGTGLYTVLLLLMSVFGQKDLAMVVQLGAIGVGLTACGSGAAKVSVGVSRVFNQPVDCGKECTGTIVSSIRYAATVLVLPVRERPANGPQSSKAPQTKYFNAHRLLPPSLPLFSPVQLCNTLRALGASSASIADTVFKVSRSMGISLCEYLLCLSMSYPLTVGKGSSPVASPGVHTTVAANSSG